jgi:hypothetical protein
MKIPILLLVYNRYEETRKLIKILRKIKPNKIYIAADGPKLQDKNDFVECLKVRKLFDQIKWKCKIYKHYNNNNLGCKISISRSINWFFKKVKQGIILEDDCMPNKDFFKFCNLMLKKYENNKKIFCISGSNYTNNVRKVIKNESSYYFSKYPHCWGWATWRRAWKYNNLNINFWTKYKNTDSWKQLHNDRTEKIYWEKIFNNAYKNNFNSWAYSWTLSVWKKKGLTIIPKKNLIENIGVGSHSENNFFRTKNDIYKSYFLNNFNKHPRIMETNQKKDLKVFYSHYKPFNYLYPWRIKHLLLILLKNPILFAKKVFKNTI